MLEHANGGTLRDQMQCLMGEERLKEHVARPLLQALATLQGQVRGWIERCGGQGFKDTRQCRLKKHVALPLLQALAMLQGQVRGWIQRCGGQGFANTRLRKLRNWVARLVQGQVHGWARGLCGVGVYKH